MSYHDDYAHQPASAVTVLISASAQPALSRVIEVPSDAPDTWLANAFLLSVGEDPLPDDDADDFRLPQPYPPFAWAPFGRFPDDDETNSSRAFTLPGVPHDLELQRLSTRVPTMGEAKVSIIEQDEPAPDQVRASLTRTRTSLAPRHAGWQTSAASLSVREVNTELADQYGLVQPRLDGSLVVDLGNGVPPNGALVQLLRMLPPVRRLALRAHLRETGLLDRPAFSEADADTVSEGLRVLIDRIGPDGVEQPDDGWLSDDVLHDVERTLGWTSEPQARLASARGSDVRPGASLLRTARDLRIIRRLKGRIVLTSVGKELRALPIRAIGLLAGYAVRGARRSGYHRSADCDDPSAVVALALLSIADGSAVSRADVPGVVARGIAVLKRRATPYGYYETDAYWPGYLDSDALFSESNVAEIIARTLERLVPVGCTESFGEFTPVVRRLAHAALL